MKSSNVILAVVGVALLIVASQFAKGQPAAVEPPAPILSKLKVGSQVRFGLTNGPPFAIAVLSDKEIEASKGKEEEAARSNVIHPTYTITEVGSDYFILQHDDGKTTREMTIPVHSVGLINRKFGSATE